MSNVILRAKKTTGVEEDIVGLPPFHENVYSFGDGEKMNRFLGIPDVFITLMSCFGIFMFLMISHGQFTSNFWFALSPWLMGQLLASYFGTIDYLENSDRSKRNGWMNCSWTKMVSLCCSGFLCVKYMLIFQVICNDIGTKDALLQLYSNEAWSITRARTFYEVDIAIALVWWLLKSVLTCQQVFLLIRTHRTHLKTFEANNTLDKLRANDSDFYPNASTLLMFLLWRLFDLLGITVYFTWIRITQRDDVMFIHQCLHRFIYLYAMLQGIRLLVLLCWTLNRMSLLKYFLTVTNAFRLSIEEEYYRSPGTWITQSLLILTATVLSIVLIVTRFKSAQSLTSMLLQKEITCLLLWMIFERVASMLLYSRLLCLTIDEDHQGPTEASTETLREQRKAASVILIHNDQQRQQKKQKQILQHQLTLETNRIVKIIVDNVGFHPDRTDQFSAFVSEQLHALRTWASLQRDPIAYSPPPLDPLFLQIADYIAWHSLRVKVYKIYERLSLNERSLESLLQPARQAPVTFRQHFPILSRLPDARSPLGYSTIQYYADKLRDLITDNEPIFVRGQGGLQRIKDLMQELKIQLRPDLMRPYFVPNRVEEEEEEEEKAPPPPSLSSNPHFHQVLLNAFSALAKAPVAPPCTRFLKGSARLDAEAKHLLEMAKLLQCQHQWSFELLREQLCIIQAAENKMEAPVSAAFREFAKMMRQQYQSVFDLTTLLSSSSATVEQCQIVIAFDESFMITMKYPLVASLLGIPLPPNAVIQQHEEEEENHPVESALSMEALFLREHLQRTIREGKDEFPVWTLQDMEEYLEALQLLLAENTSVEEMRVMLMEGSAEGFLPFLQHYGYCFREDMRKVCRDASLNETQEKVVVWFHMSRLQTACPLTYRVIYLMGQGPSPN